MIPLGLELVLPKAESLVPSPPGEGPCDPDVTV